jgi:3-phenylpropionate/trans-cinnamate dioxygenase ferredoxin reductase subunit
VIVGGGYLGLEAAAGLTKLGKNVTLVDACERLLSRVAAEPLSRFYEMEHRSHGVDIRLKTEVRSIERVASRLRARLTDGDLVPCDLIIAGVGIEPEVEPLLAAGAEGRNGVRVDDECRTSLHDVFAIGDCALHANVFAEGADVRLESIQNANDMANAVAKTLSGIPTSYEAVPWFWSPTKCPTIAS